MSRSKILWGVLGLALTAVGGALALCRMHSEPLSAAPAGDARGAEVAEADQGARAASYRGHVVRPAPCADRAPQAWREVDGRTVADVAGTEDPDARAHGYEELLAGPEGVSP